MSIFPKARPLFQLQKNEHEYDYLDNKFEMQWNKDIIQGKELAEKAESKRQRKALKRLGKAP